jgi:hypothetical protein
MTLRLRRPAAPSVLPFYAIPGWAHYGGFSGNSAPGNLVRPLCCRAHGIGASRRNLATVTIALPCTRAPSQSGNLFGSIIVVTGPEQGRTGTFAIALKETVLPFHSMCGLSFMPNGKCIPNCGFFLAKSCMHSYSAFVPAPARTSIAHPKKWRDGLDREQGPFSPAHTQLCSSLVRCADVTVTEPCVSTKARRNTALASINGRLRRSIFFSS